MNQELTILEQPELFYGLDRIDRSLPRYHATAERFQQLRPHEYRIAVELIGRGQHSDRELEQLLHVSHHTLEAVRSKEGERLAALREKCARRNLQLHEMCLERAAELIPQCTDLQKVAVSSGIYAEKSNLLAGEATARLESIQPVNVVEQFAQFCERLTKRVEARVIGDVPKNMAAKGAAALPEPAPTSWSRSRGPIADATAIVPITSNNKRNIKSNVVDSEGFTNNQTDSDKYHNESAPIKDQDPASDPAPGAAPGEGAVAAAAAAADRDG